MSKSNGVKLSGELLERKRRADERAMRLLEKGRVLRAVLGTRASCGERERVPIRELAALEGLSHEIVRRMIRRARDLETGKREPAPPRESGGVQVTEAGTEMPTIRPWKHARGGKAYWRVTKAEQEAAMAD